jgi:predicted AAA+ superfamily ATPase
MDQIKGIIIDGERVHNVGYSPFLLAKARRLRIPNYEADNVEEGTKQRELKSLLRAMKVLDMKEGLIITEDFEGEEKINGGRIIYKPLWKWLLRI